MGKSTNIELSPNYKNIQSNFKTLGKSLNFSGYKKPYFENFGTDLSLSNLGKLYQEVENNDSKKFGDIYRRVDKGKDELFSTQNTFHLLRGVFEKKIGEKKIQNLIQDLSKLRMYTENVGGSYKSDNRMIFIWMHPTSINKKFIFSRRTSSAHIYMDRNRGYLIYNKIKNNYSVKNFLKSIILTNLRIINPLTAENAITYNDLTDFERISKVIAQNKDRERIKKMGIKLGIKQKKGSKEAWRKFKPDDSDTLSQYREGDANLMELEDLDIEVQEGYMQLESYH